MKPKEFLLAVLPRAITAARYAAQVQSRVSRQPSKSGDSDIRQALSDADLSIQTFFEVLLLGDFPEFSFFGEEHEHSVNTKYFPEGREQTVLLDPVDGTLLYLHGKSEFAVVVTLINKRGYQATLWVYPREGVFWFACEETGVLLGKLEDRDAPERWERQRLIPNDREVLTYCSEGASAQLRRDFSVFDCRKDFEPERPFYKGLELFHGKWAGVYAEDVYAIDIGALSFMASLLGATVSDRFGSSLPAPYELDGFRYPSIVIAATSEVHKKMVQRVKQ